MLSSNNINENTIPQLFIPLNFSLPQAMASIAVPGDSLVLPFAGLYMDYEEILNYHQLRVKLIQENTPLQDPNMSFIANNGSIAVFWKLEGKALNGGSYASDAVDYFQVIVDPAGDIKIAKISRYFDTWAVTLALTNGKKFPQYSQSFF